MLEAPDGIEGPKASPTRCQPFVPDNREANTCKQRGVLQPIRGFGIAAALVAPNGGGRLPEVVMSPMVHTLLHVEDDSNDVLLLQRAIRRAALPIAALSVGDGEAAVAYLNGDGVYGDRRQYPMPELVLLDLKIPRKSGLEVLSWIRAHPRLGRLPVTVLTSSRHERDMEQAYDRGANSYLVKPVGFDALLEMTRLVSAYWFSLNQRPAS